MFMTMRF